ncbi:hypothetical protein DOY81_006083 [Sarcophaga bullata]|nr:hypothetical protein DOY81_006083 [Sarcophaga bullata]
MDPKLPKVAIKVMISMKKIKESGQGTSSTNGLKSSSDDESIPEEIISPDKEYNYPRDHVGNVVEQNIKPPIRDSSKGISSGKNQQGKRQKQALPPLNLCKKLGMIDWEILLFCTWKKTLVHWMIGSKTGMTSFDGFHRAYVNHFIYYNLKETKVENNKIVCDVALISNEGYSYVTEVPSLPSSHQRHSNLSKKSEYYQPADNDTEPGYENSRVRRTHRKITHNEKRYHSVEESTNKSSPPEFVIPSYDVLK